MKKEYIFRYGDRILYRGWFDEYKENPEPCEVQVFAMGLVTGLRTHLKHPEIRVCESFGDKLILLQK